MAQDKERSSAEEAVEQQGSQDWPRPGEEGYVHPDGTLQSRRQLEENQRAAADRAAAGSTVHGAPLATPGPNPDAERVKAEERAEEYSGPSAAEARRGLTEFIREGVAGETAEGDDAKPADQAGKRTAADTTPKTKR